MNENEWRQWLENWLDRHPLPKPPEWSGNDYVRQVMERIRPAPAPEPLWQRWLQPRPAFALAGTFAAALIMLAVYRNPAWTQTRLEQESQLLLDAGELPPLNGAALEQNLREQDRIQLAEAVEEQKWWSDFVQDSELLEELQETGTEESKHRVTDEELLKEIRLSDEREVAVS